jgi:hypothetical protein
MIASQHLHDEMATTITSIVNLAAIRMKEKMSPILSSKEQQITSTPPATCTA